MGMEKPQLIERSRWILTFGQLVKQPEIQMVTGTPGKPAVPGQTWNL